MTSNALLNSSGDFQHILEGPATVYGQQGGTHRWYTAASASSGATASSTERTRITAAGAIIHKGAAVFNEDGGDNDFRVESDANANALFVDAAANNVCFGAGVASGATNMGYFHVAANNCHLNVTNTQTSNITACYYANRQNSDGHVMLFKRGGTSVGSIYVTGSSTAYNTSSDYRLKTDAQPMTGASARVQALNPVNFEWIADGTRVDGFLAHEAQEVVPESVTGTKDAMRDEEYEVTAAIEATYDDDGNELTAAVDAVMGTRSVPDMQGIDQSKIVPLLTAALREALTKIDTMETRLAALEAV
jgi:hypothetical protein